jgi:two-component system, NarL family, response regulator LiaR
MSKTVVSKTNTPETIRVLIADDHPVVRQGMMLFLSTQEGVEIVALAETGLQAVQMVEEHLPDVVLMDLNMPELNGIEATKQIRQKSPHTQVVVLTSHHEDGMVFPAIKAGALSYLLKSATPEDVLDALRAAAKREARLHPRIAQQLMQEVSGQRPSVDALTTKELEILKVIAQGKDNATIAREMNLSDKTVKTHVSNILSKLYVQDRTQAAIYALKQRLVPLDDG